MEFEKRENKWLERIVLVGTTFIITFLITAIIVINKFNINYQNTNNDPGTILSILSEGDNNNSKYNILNEITALLDAYYLRDIDKEKLIDGAAKGMVEAVDDVYTEYIPKSDTQEFTETITGTFEGIGIYVSANTETNEIVVISPIKDSPAEKAGIQAEDVIIKVDGVEYNAETLNEAISKMKGEEGTTVKITIKRDNKTLDVNVKREKIKTTHVETEVLDKNIGYVTIATFDEGCYDEFKEKVDNLIKEKKVKGLIIDVRNNPGGILTEVLKIADYILPECEIISIVDKNSNRKVYKSDSNHIDVPIIVLINEGSASASEILAGTIKDNDRGKLIGNTTYGKGVVQEVRKLSDGSMLKITVSEYYTPSNNKIDGNGIEPDIEVDLPKEYENSLTIPQNKDTQLKKALEEIKK